MERQYIHLSLLILALVLFLLPVSAVAEPPAGAVKFVILKPTDGTVGTPVTVTVEAQKSNNKVDESYQNDVTLVANGSATGGGLVDIVNGVGNREINDSVAETVTLSLSDTESTGLDVTSAREVTFVPAEVGAWNQQKFWFRDDDGDEIAATGFGAEDVSQNTNIINVAPGADFRLRFAIKLTRADGSIAPQLEFKEGTDCTTGSWTIIASESSVFNLQLSPNFIDAAPTTQRLAGGPNFIAGQILESTNPAGSLSMLKNESTEYEWSLRISLGAPFATTYSFRITNNGAVLDIYDQCPSLTTQSPPPPPPSPTCGDGTVDTGEQCDDGSANGVCPATCSASCTINDCTPPPPPPPPSPTCGDGTVDTGEQCDDGSANGVCPATCSASCTINDCTPPPPPPPPSSGGGGGWARPTTVIFSGKAFPGAKILVIDKPVADAARTVSQEIVTRDDGSFQTSFIGIMQSRHSFGLIIKDKEGRNSQTKFFTIDVLANDLIVKDVVISPTIDFASRLVTRGNNATIIGYASPESSVALEIDGIIKKEVKAEKDGSYRAEIATGELDFSNYRVRAKQKIQKENRESDFSPTNTLVVSRLVLPKADLNDDGKVDIKDWSMFLFHWTSKDMPQKKIIDFNGDGKVDISDFSIFVRNIRK